MIVLALNVSIYQDPYSKSEKNTSLSRNNGTGLNNVLSNEANDSMIWKICCNSDEPQKQKTTFQSFLNVIKIKEFSKNQVTSF